MSALQVIGMVPGRDDRPAELFCLRRAVALGGAECGQELLALTDHLFAKFGDRRSQLSDLVLSRCVRALFGRGSLLPSGFELRP